MKTGKFYNFDQNNSGGYFINNDENGVCEEVIIEAESAKKAWEKLNEIGNKVDGFFDFCNCCGERWYNYLSDDEGTTSPMIYGELIENTEKSMFRNRCYVHYLDGTFKEFKFKH